MEGNREYVRNYKKTSQRYKEYKQEENLKIRSVLERIECKCPKCGKLFQKNLFWTGRLPARVYCDNCEGLARTTSDIDYYNIAFGRER